MNTNWKGEEIPAYMDITLSDINALIDGRVFTFPKDVVCITEDVIPYYCATPRTLKEHLNMLCLRGKIKRGSYLIE